MGEELGAACERLTLLPLTVGFNLMGCGHLWLRRLPRHRKMVVLSWVSLCSCQYRTVFCWYFAPFFLLVLWNPRAKALSVEMVALLYAV